MKSKKSLKEYTKPITTKCNGAIIIIDHTNHCYNLTIALTVVGISTFALYSLTNMRATAKWPFSQANIRAVYPSYQHTISTYQTNIHTQHTPMHYTIIILLHRPPST